MPYKLTPKQRTAARLIAEGELDADIQKQLNMLTHTLDRWRRIPAFHDAIERHTRNMEEVMPRRIRLMRNLSVSAACAELAYCPDAKNMQKLHRIIRRTKQLTDIELGAYESGNETMKQLFKDAEKAVAPGLIQELQELSEKTNTPLNATKTRKNDQESPKISLRNPQDIDIQEYIEKNWDEKTKNKWNLLAKHMSEHHDISSFLKS